MNYLVLEEITAKGYQIEAPILPCTEMNLHHPGLARAAIDRHKLSQYFETDGQFDYFVDNGSCRVRFFHESTDHNEILNKIEEAQLRFSRFLSELVRFRDYAQFWVEFEKEK